MAGTMYWKLDKLTEIKVKLINEAMDELFRKRVALLDKAYDKAEVSYYILTGELPEKGILVNREELF